MACQSDSAHDSHATEAVASSTIAVKTSANQATNPDVTAVKTASAAVEALGVVKSEVAKVWSVSVSSKNKHFDGVLTCQQLPFVGEFQQCHLQLSQSANAVDNALLAIEGGMKAHGHGLPTKPKLSAVGNQTGQYKIDGLKFSMTGAWTIGFLIEANGVNDQLIFDFTI